VRLKEKKPSKKALIAAFSPENEAEGTLLIPLAAEADRQLARKAIPVKPPLKWRRPA
jgi:hypothetical protein